MSAGARSQGRKPNVEQKPGQERRSSDAVMAYLSKDTGAKRPDWMERPELLPRKPPGVKREGQS